MSSTVEFVNRLLDEIALLQYDRSYNMLTMPEREDVMRRACVDRPALNGPGGHRSAWEARGWSPVPPRMAIPEAETAPGRANGPGTVPNTSNVAKARQRLVVRFDAFARHIHDSEREDFFHPCNADAWVREFARWLDEEQTESADVRASND